jgi:hypothetical protein
MEVIMNASVGSNKSAVTTGSALSGANAGNVKRTEPRVASRIVKCLIAPALVALVMLGAHWNVFGSVHEVQPEAAYEDAEIDYFPPAYAFRAIDFDDPFNAY